MLLLSSLSDGVRVIRVWFVDFLSHILALTDSRRVTFGRWGLFDCVVDVIVGYVLGSSTLLTRFL